MVIFIFLRSFWATVIPTITVPLALLGACALMWVFGYTLDNLSLMALTIAVGFVVDDAIVMLENITRYIEEGEKPMAAAFKGASEIGFTIVSISVSLVAVLIPLLLMGGIIGRLFREFAVTLAMTIFVSMIVSLTLTPMMASRFLRAHGETRHGRFYQWSERAFDAMLHAYERGLDLALRWKFTTLMIFFATLGIVGLSVRHHPEGLLSAAGQRPDHGHLGGQPGHFLRRDEAASGGTRQDRAGRSRRRLGRDGDRRQRPGRQQRQPVHHAEAAQRAQGDRAADHRPAASQAGEGRGRPPVSCRRRRTCGSAAGRREPSSSSRCRTPTSPS